LQLKQLDGDGATASSWNIAVVRHSVQGANDIVDEV
jgi:hypothetical protein